MDKIDRIITTNFSEDAGQMMKVYDKLYPSDGFSPNPFSDASRIVIFLKSARKDGNGNYILNQNGNPVFKDGNQVYKYLDPADFFVIKHKMENLNPWDISSCVKKLKAMGMGEDAQKVIQSFMGFNSVIFESENLLPYDKTCNPDNKNEFLVTGIKITYDKSQSQQIAVEITHSYCPKEKAGNKYILDKKRPFNRIQQRFDFATFKKTIDTTCDFVQGMRYQAMSNYFFHRSEKVFENVNEEEEND